MSTRVVVAYDFTKPADVALQHAVELACQDPEQVLHFVIVVDSHQSYQTADKIREDFLERLKRTFAVRETHGDVDFYVHARIGSPADEILALAREIGADLIVLGCHDRSALGRILIGSVSSAVLHGARCPVLIARPKGYPEVALQKVVEVAHVTLRPMPHRYSYSSKIAQVRSNDWPIG